MYLFQVLVTVVGELQHTSVFGLCFSDCSVRAFLHLGDIGVQVLSDVGQFTAHCVCLLEVLLCLAGGKESIDFILRLRDALVLLPSPLLLPVICLLTVVFDFTMSKLVREVGRPFSFDV